MDTSLSGLAALQPTPLPPPLFHTPPHTRTQMQLHFSINTRIMKWKLQKEWKAKKKRGRETEIMRIHMYKFLKTRLKWRFK